MYIPLPGVLFKVNEFAFLLLPILNIFCSSKVPKYRVNRRLRKYILLYLFLVVLMEFFFKPLVFNQSFVDSFKGFRIGLPFYSSLILLYNGIRADIKKVWQIILYAIGCSVLLSVLSIFIRLPIYYGMEGEDVLEFLNGRIMNSNSSFGVVGLYLLFRDKDKWYNQGKLVKYVAIMSVIALIINFNRTYLALLVLETLWLLYKTFSIKIFKTSVLYGLLFVGGAIFAYNKSPLIQKQVDKRILSIVQGTATLEESTIENNRDKIYEGIQERIKEGYWVIGMPYNQPIFYKNDRVTGGVLGLRTTDISFINILLRYGIICLLLAVLIYREIYKVNNALLVKVILVIYALASLNLDALFIHNSVFFLFIIFLLTFYSNNYILHEKKEA